MFTWVPVLGKKKIVLNTYVLKRHTIINPIQYNRDKSTINGEHRVYRYGHLKNPLFCRPFTV